MPFCDASPRSEAGVPALRTLKRPLANTNNLCDDDNETEENSANYTAPPGALIHPKTLVDVVYSAKAPDGLPRILSIGSGNCSLELSLAMKHLPSTTGADMMERHCLDVSVLERSREEFKWQYSKEDGDSNICALEALGQKVLFGVDARRLRDTLEEAAETQTGRPTEPDRGKLRAGERFCLFEAHSESANARSRRFAYTVVYFANPYPAIQPPITNWGKKGKKNGKKGCGKHPEHPHKYIYEMMPKFFRDCKLILFPGGFVLITMTETQFKATGLKECAEREGFELVAVLNFEWKQVEPYYKPSFGDRRAQRDIAADSKGQGKGSSNRRATFVSEAGTRTYQFRIKHDFQAQTHVAQSAKRRKIEVAASVSSSSSFGRSAGGVVPTENNASSGTEDLGLAGAPSIRKIFGANFDPASCTFESALKFLVDMFRNHGCTDATVSEGREKLIKFFTEHVKKRTRSNADNIEGLQLVGTTSSAAATARTKHDASLALSDYICATMWRKGWDRDGRDSPDIAQSCLVRLLHGKRCRSKNPSDAFSNEVWWTCPELPEFDFFVKKTSQLVRHSPHARPSSPRLAVGVRITKSSSDESFGTWFVKDSVSLSPVLRYDPEMKLSSGFPWGCLYSEP
ncbi:unnamed protein product [Amoebophrya sp. A120]|nr:unnamed protein product [Amoebophrya sp. A120]|eukprot:GSA120T00011632001.1